MYSVKYWILGVKGFGSSIYQDLIIVWLKTTTTKPLFICSNISFFSNTHSRIFSLKNTQFYSLCVLFIPLQRLWINLKCLTFYRDTDGLILAHCFCYSLSHPFLLSTDLTLDPKPELLFPTFIYCFMLLLLHQTNLYSFFKRAPQEAFLWLS